MSFSKKLYSNICIWSWGVGRKGSVWLYSEIGMEMLGCDEWAAWRENYDMFNKSLIGNVQEEGKERRRNDDTWIDGR